MKNLGFLISDFGFGRAFRGLVHRGEDRGQLVTAFVVLKAGYVSSLQMETDLQQFVKDNFAPYKYPRKIIFVDQLPRTETGKVQRFKLHQLA